MFLMLKKSADRRQREALEVAFKVSSFPVDLVEFVVVAVVADVDAVVNAYLDAVMLLLMLILMCMWLLLSMLMLQ